MSEWRKIVWGAAVIVGLSIIVAAYLLAPNRPPPAPPPPDPSANASNGVEFWEGYDERQRQRAQQNSN